MAIGELHVICGPMFSGKTERLIKEILFSTHFDAKWMRSCVLKPAFDCRSGPDEIASHDGKCARATRIAGPMDSVIGRFETVFFDEVQFCEPPFFKGDFIDFVRRIRNAGANVVCAGLDMDANGVGFEITARLMAESTKITRLAGKCSLCEAPATHTRRVSVTGPRLEVGGWEKYRPVCLRHWSESDGEA